MSFQNKLPSSREVGLWQQSPRSTTRERCQRSLLVALDINSGLLDCFTRPSPVLPALPALSHALYCQGPSDKQQTNNAGL